MHYAPSPITANQHQACASKLIVGQRIVPHVFVCAADARPFNIQDLLPSDTRFKILIFAGNTADQAQMVRVQALAEQMGKPDGFLARFGKGEYLKVFDILSISSAKKQVTNYTGEHWKGLLSTQSRSDPLNLCADLPRLFRPHWSK